MSRFQRLILAPRDLRFYCICRESRTHIDVTLPVLNHSIKITHQVKLTTVTGERIKESDEKFWKFTLKEGRKKDSTLFWVVHNSGTRLRADFSCSIGNGLSWAGCDFPYSIIPLAKAHLSLLISVSWAKMLSPWFSFEDLHLLCASDSPQRDQATQ